MDLEIFEKSKNLFGESDEQTKRIKQKVKYLMLFLYRERDPRAPRFVRKADLAFAVACFAGAGAFAFSWHDSDRHWELIVALLLGFLSLGGFLNTFSRNYPSLSLSTQPPDDGHSTGG